MNKAEEYLIEKDGKIDNSPHPGGTFIHHSRVTELMQLYADEHGEEKYNQGYEAGRKDVDELTEKADLNGYSRGIADKEQYAGEQSRETAVEYASFTWMLDDDDFTGKTPYEIFDKWKSNQKEQ
jgi:hypothetical protein